MKRFKALWTILMIGLTLSGCLANSASGGFLDTLTAMRGGSGAGNTAAPPTPTPGVADPQYFIGSTYIHGDDVFDLQVGDSITLYNPMLPSGAYYAYSWVVVEGDPDIVMLDRLDGSCLILAQEPGTVKISAELNSYRQGLDPWIREYVFTINVSNRTWTPTASVGSVDTGFCPRCFGRKEIETSQGWITCTWCRGSGMWTN